MSEISIIVVTYNSRKAIARSLDSIFNQTFKQFEVIVIDNGSKDYTVDFIKENYPQVKIIKNIKNEGVCKAKNQGINIAKGKYILTLSDSVVLKRDFLDEVRKTMDRFKDKIGMVGVKILKSDKKTIYSAGLHLSRFFRYYDIGKNHLDCERFNRQRYIFGPNSAAAVYRRDMLEDIKKSGQYFDEDFFLFAEDVDLAWRAKKRGWKCIFCNTAVCYYYDEGYNKYPKEFIRYMSFRNRYFLLTKHIGVKQYLLSLLIFDIPQLLKILFCNRSAVKHTFKASLESIRIMSKSLEWSYLLPLIFHDIPKLTYLLFFNKRFFTAIKYFVTVMSKSIETQDYSGKPFELVSQYW